MLWWLAALTMIVGNVLAVSQKNIKRLLAYSSISHAGFILMAFVSYGDKAVTGDAVASALFYLLAFAVTSYGVWAVVISLEQSEDGADGMRKGLNLDDYAGLGRRNPGLALAMIINARGSRLRGLAIALFALQLVLNLAWSPLFFGMHQVSAALFLLVAIFVAALATTLVFGRIRPAAGSSR